MESDTFALEPAPFAPLFGAFFTLVLLLAQPTAVATMAWAVFFAVRKKTRAYGLSVFRWGAWGWTAAFVVWMAWAVLGAVMDGRTWVQYFSGEWLLVSALLANAGFVLGGVAVAAMDYEERFEPPWTRV